MSSKIGYRPVLVRSESRGPTTVVRVRPRRDCLSGTKLLVLVWTVITLLPWALQVRSFLLLALPHAVLPDLVVDEFAAPETDELSARCPAKGLRIAGIWWNVWATHYTTREGRQHVCHFVTQQFNLHGAYLVSSDSIVWTKACGDAPAIQVYYYHGSIGYVSYYAGGDGVYCDDDKTGYVMTKTLGTAGMNGDELARDTGGGGRRRWSAWFVCAGASWIIYRVFVLHRSLVLCVQFGRRCDHGRESISFQVAAVYIQETVRLAPHDARNAHRFMLVYFLVEGLMADLFLMIAKEDTGAMLQFVSIGYNLAGMLSMLFEVLENTTWLSERVYRVVRRLLFNNEMEFVGELLCAGIMQRFISTLNRSRFRDSLAPAQAVSYYVWSLVGHGSVLIVLLGIVFTIRALGALAIARVRYGTVRMLTSPNCVDMVLRGRLKYVLLLGFVWRDGQLYHSRETLKAYGLLRTTDDKESADEMLVHHQVSWRGSPSERNLMVVGRITGGHNVVPISSIRPCDGDVVFCDRILGSDGIMTRRRVY
jgi:hypothetical protein